MSFKEPRPEDYAIPGQWTDKAFGKVDVRPTGQGITVRFTILMPPQGRSAEGWQTGVALDGSSSMKRHYGRSLVGALSKEFRESLVRQHLLITHTIDGRQVEALTPRGEEEALTAGHLKRTSNAVEPLARDFIAYLARELDEDGGTTVIYWACGGPESYEVVGDFTAEQCPSIALPGPSSFGSETALLPALRYFIERFGTAQRGMYVFVTDGLLSDLPAVATYTRELATAISQRKANPLKCVLIGVGDDVDMAQLRALDELETGTDIDIWDCKLATDLRQLVEIFAEVVDEHVIVAPSATIYGSAGQVVARFTDGLPAAVTVDFPSGTEWFELEAGGQRIRQTLVVPDVVV